MNGKRKLFKLIEHLGGTGMPKLTWKKLKEKDCREWQLTTIDPKERSTWRSGVRSANCMQLRASYLERGPLMLMMSLHLQVNQKSDYDMMIRTMQYVCVIY